MEPLDDADLGDALGLYRRGRPVDQLRVGGAPEDRREMARATRAYFCIWFSPV